MFACVSARRLSAFTAETTWRQLGHLPCRAARVALTINGLSQTGQQKRIPITQRMPVSRFRNERAATSGVASIH
jgi:hypothetical protein